MSASLAVGGAERSVVGLVEHWAAGGHEVTLVTLASAQTDFYSIPPGVRRVGLDLLAPSSWMGEALVRTARRARRLRAALREARPDVILAFVDQINVLTLLAAIGLGVPIIVAERVDPRQHRIGRIWSGLRRVAYRWADLLVVQTQAVRPWAEAVVAPSRVRVIPNAIRLPEPRAADRAPLVLGMGRLVRQKRFDVLLEAFRLVARDHPAWSLEILGDGPLRPALAEAAADLDGRVRLRGVVDDPGEHLWRAGIFVLASDFEGFPNALVEAMACGCAVVATDCPSGPDEILRGGEDGLLVPRGDPAALARALGRLMGDPAERRRLGARAREAAGRYAEDRVLPQWDACLDTVRQGRGSSA